MFYMEEDASCRNLLWNKLACRLPHCRIFFDQVTLIRPLAQAEVDPATLQATGHADAVPVLNADGRGWQPILGEDTGFVFYQNIQVEHRPFVLAATYFLTADLPANDREANALLRLLGYDSSSLAGSFPTAQLSKAGSVGLLDDVTAKQGQTLTRQTASPSSITCS